MSVRVLKSKHNAIKMRLNRLVEALPDVNSYNALLEIKEQIIKMVQDQDTIFNNMIKLEGADADDITRDCFQFGLIVENAQNMLDEKFRVLELQIIMDQIDEKAKEMESFDGIRNGDKFVCQNQMVGMRMVLPEMCNDMRDAFEQISIKGNPDQKTEANQKYSDFENRFLMVSEWLCNSISNSSSRKTPHSEKSEKIAQISSPTFDGSPEKWTSFHDSLESIICNKNQFEHITQVNSSSKEEQINHITHHAVESLDSLTTKIQSKSMKLGPQQHKQILSREDPHQPIRAYELNTANHGTFSASCQSTRCLDQLAIEQKHEMSNAASEHFDSEGKQSLADIISHISHISQRCQGAEILLESVTNWPRPIFTLNSQDFVSKGTFEKAHSVNVIRNEPRRLLMVKVKMKYLKNKIHSINSKSSIKILLNLCIKLFQLKNLFEEFQKFFSFQTAQTVIHNHMMQQNVIWHLIPPRAQLFGRKWEAGAKSMKHDQRHVVTNARFNYEESSTLICRIKATLNLHPLNSVSDNHTDLTIHQATKAQQRWSQKYLQHLQTHPKNYKPIETVQVGQTLMLEIENQPSMTWPTGRIIDKHPKQDGITEVAHVKASHTTLDRFIPNLGILLIENNEQTGRPQYVNAY
jgi:Family of unknown function (DUF5641)